MILPRFHKFFPYVSRVISYALSSQNVNPKELLEPNMPSRVSDRLILIVSFINLRPCYPYSPPKLKLRPEAKPPPTLPWLPPVESLNLELLLDCYLSLELFRPFARTSSAFFAPLLRNSRTTRGKLQGNAQNTEENFCENTRGNRVKLWIQCQFGHAYQFGTPWVGLGGPSGGTSSGIALLVVFHVDCIIVE
jgi:hypothetical protein